MNLLTVKDYVTLTQDGDKLHKPIHFTLEKGEILWIRGVNGSGKTSFLRTLLRQHRKHLGSIQLGTSFKNIAYLPQLTQPHFFIPLHLHDLLEKKDSSLMNQDQWHRSWNTASGGERQKTLLIRIFNQAAELYLLDEPTNQLDVQGQQVLKEKLEILTRRKVQGAVIICHDENFMSHLPYKEVFLEDG